MKPNKLRSIMLLIGIFFSVSMNAFEAFELEGIAYNITSSKDMTVEVVSKSGRYSGDVVIPEKITYNGSEYSVTGIYQLAFNNCKEMTSITIPKSMKIIGYSPFSGCSGLNSVNISDLSSWCQINFQDQSSNPLTYAHHLFLNGQEIKDLVLTNGITSVGKYAFCYCEGLSSVSIGKDLTNIGLNAFYNCSNLNSIVVDDLNDIYDSRNNCNAIIEKSSKKLIVGCRNTIIPIGVTSIGDYAFYGCSSLTSIDIPNSVTTIGNYAFRFCSGLTSITIPNSLISIGNWAFAGCCGLDYISIPNSVTNIGGSAFSDCSGLTSISLPNSVTGIEGWTFSGCSGLTKITLPNCVTSIGKCAFMGCSGLTFITIPKGVTSIGDEAFSGCSDLASLTIPNTVTSIGESAFYNCNKIKDLIIPNSVTSLGAKAFQFCRGLESVYIGENVVYIKENLFNGCSKIKKVTSGIKEPMNMVSSVFDNSVYTNAELIVPEDCLSKYQACDGWKNFVNIKDTGGGIPYKDKLSLDKATGYTGKQIVLPIKLINESEIAGVQFKLTLPAGVSVALNSKNKLMFSKTERDADHTLSGSKAEDGSYTVLLYSADTEAITGNDGSIIDVTLDIDKEMKDGTYEIKISDVVLSTTKAVKINADDVTAQLEVKSYLLGDPNNDGSIDVVDITMIANHILGNNPENFIFAAADVDVDGTVDVNDIISIANIILYGSNTSNAKPSMAKALNHLVNNVTSNDSNGDGFTVKNVSVKKGGTVTVDFELTNAAHDFSGIQMDIDLGDGLSFATKSNGKVNVTRGARLEDEDFTLSVAKQEGNQYRALGYYTDGSVIPEKSGTLFTLTLQADESLADGKTFNCQLNNITLSTKNNEKIQQETQTFTVTIGDPTGISDIINEDGTPAVMYDLTGKRIETPAKSGQVIIIKKGGKVVKVFKK